MTTKRKKPDPASLGYVNIRISKKAHKELAKRAMAEDRSMVATLNRILGV